MPHKILFIYQLFFCSHLDSLLVIIIVSLEREEERGSISTCIGEEGSGTKPGGRPYSNGGIFVSFFNELDTDRELCS
jgi:hypothetical protein